MNRLTRYLFITAGFCCFALAIAGIFLPLLPTTPFLLLATACFFRSSDRLYRWITSHKLFGPPIMGYRRFHAISRKAKMVSIITLWAVIGSSSYFAVSTLWLRIVLLATAIGLTVYLLRIRTLTHEMRVKLSDGVAPPNGKQGR